MISNHRANVRGVSWQLSLCSLLCLAGLMGCGGGDPKLNSVSGTVTRNGEKLLLGTIVFIPTGETKGSTAGSEIKDGEYSVPQDQGLMEGSFRVEIRSPKETGKQIEVGSPSPPGTMMKEVKESLPARYNSKSELEAQIPAPQNTLNFELTVD